jgi:hypothetical protein
VEGELGGGEAGKKGQNSNAGFHGVKYRDFNPVGV